MKILATLTRICTDDLEATLAFYGELLGEACSRRFRYGAAGLELAQVGNVLILAGSEQALAPFEETRATLLVDSLTGFRELLLARGAVIIRDVQPVPTGRNLTVRHPDGAVFEYVEFGPGTDRRD